ncbi:DUF2516 family protein [Actinokineospora sp. NBRC 105648]|uniref:DUF2516 family protein n=1 Tax=Actinokineospora sp. NBRC 105648 TaxID=3032206 RepID=UPI0024A1FC77|nr:DUF2516 family protein [Actinokineospora sp. NBRC 105648]GLZ38258.1 hypothetical protein Acsp05_18820 [Actinokineospora sp. NBRC 105648]
MPATATWILSVIDWAAVPVGVFALIHALLQRPDAYSAADRLTKPAWVGITAGATAVLLLFSFAGTGWIFWMAGLVAALVYIVDVRPKLIEVQRGQRW